MTAGARRVLLAMDKFKGSLTAERANAALAAGLLRADPALEIRLAPIADGGDGTLAAAFAAGFTPVNVLAHGPTGRPRQGTYARRADTALLEMAGLCGLALLGNRRYPLTATSRGLGSALAAALDSGAERIVLGIGGSASTDGGAGMLAALGARLLTASGRELPPGGGSLVDLERIDLSGLDPRLARVALVVASDVDNPLLGPEGAVATYAPQKGAGPLALEQLERGLTRFASVMAQTTGRDLSGAAGAGAAGGVGFAALGLGAGMRPGISYMLELVDFERALEGVQVVITGEGRIDEQTLAGKAPAGVASAARARGIPVVAVGGRVDLSPDQLAGVGIGASYSLGESEPDLARSMARAAPLLRRIGERIGSALAAA